MARYLRLRAQIGGLRHQRSTSTGVTEPGTAVHAQSGDPVLIGDIVDILRREVTEVAEVTVESRVTVVTVIMIEITTEIETVTDTDREMILLAVIGVQDILTEMITVIEKTELLHTQVT